MDLKSRRILKVGCWALIVTVLGWTVNLAQPAGFAQDEAQRAPSAGETEKAPAQSTKKRLPDYVDADELSQDNSRGEVAEWRKTEAISHYWLANSYFKRWNLELAGIELQESIMYWSGLQASHKDLCLVYLLSGHPLKALAQFMICMGWGEPIPLTVAEQAQLNDTAKKLHYRLGLKSGRENNWLEAVTELQWALSYQPSDAKIYRSLAFAYANIGNFDKAEQFYQTTFNMNPGEAFSHADFAFVLADKGRSTQAREQLSEAVRLAPSAAALHVDLGWMAEAGGDFGGAEREFKAAIELSSGHGGLWAHLGRIYEHEGKKAEAIEAFQRALKLDPEQDDARARLARLKDAEESEKKGSEG